MLERLARALQKKTIDNDAPKMKAIGTQQAKLAELRRVQDENNRILKRIRDAQSAYDHVQWEEDAKKREKYIMNMSEFSPQNTSYQLPNPLRQTNTPSKDKMPTIFPKGNLESRQRPRTIS